MQELVARSNDPKMIEQQRWSDLKETPWRRQQQQLRNKAKQRARRGQMLLRQTTAGDRNKWLLCAEDRDIFNEYKSGEAVETLERLRVSKPKLMCA